MTEYDSRAKEYVEHLIRKEMEKMPRLEDIYPTKDSFEFNFPHDNSFLQTEYARICQVESMENIETTLQHTPFDGQRYQVKEPLKDEKNSIEAWKNAIQHACIQYELQKKRLMNLEILAENQDNAINRELEHFESMNKSLRYDALRAINQLGLLQTRLQLYKKQYEDPLLVDNTWKYLIANNPRLTLD